MKINIFLILMILPFLGCSDFSIRNIDRPAANLYEYWIDGRHSELEIKTALLECGYPNPFGNPKITAWKISNEQYVVSYKCMLKSGFIDNKYSKENYNLRCNNPKGSFCGTDMYGVMHCQPRPSACDLPWDQIPDRSIKKRLESDYCKHKIYKTYPVCQP
ncbi:MAG: hypothetical protein PHO65_10115 [Sulfurovum sp.]|nr:hypothetical protein [Sulfurovum sp.]